MLIMGLHNGEDAGACLVKDGVLVEAVNEERFNRCKLFLGEPKSCVDYLLDRHGLSLDAIDRFAYSWHGRQNDYADYAIRLTKRVIRALGDNPDCGPIVQTRVSSEFTRDAMVRDKFDSWMAEMGAEARRIAYFDHHQSHAWSAFACSPFDRALVVTMDGRGDLKSMSVSVADDRGIQELDYALSFDSLGFLYGQITHFLGFMPHRHEGKVTGLAAYGDPSKALPLLRSLINWQDGAIVAKLGPYKPFYTELEPELVALLSAFSKEDLAAAVQKHCEELCVKLVAHWLDNCPKPRPRHVCLAGGVFANVRINQCVSEIPGVDDLFIFPHMGDGGLAVGAALLLSFRQGGQAKCDLPSALLGPSFSAPEINQALRGLGTRVQFRKPANIVAETVECLRAGKVVGWFEGRMEFGPRALGGRSILFPARDRTANDWLNKRLHRTEFMPFAPVTPEELAHDCYIGWQRNHKAAHFMTRTYNCSNAFAKRHPAVVHIDGTARPQIVSADRNHGYYDVVRSYCGQTGDQALINTSFNQHEEPIVCSPDDALGSLVNDNVDILAIGDYLVMRA